MVTFVTVSGQGENSVSLYLQIRDVSSDDTIDIIGAKRIVSGKIC
jgi:hypothetical protein